MPVRPIEEEFLVEGGVIPGFAEHFEEEVLRAPVRMPAPASPIRRLVPPQVTGSRARPSMVDIGFGIQVPTAPPRTLVPIAPPSCPPGFVWRP